MEKLAEEIWKTILFSLLLVVGVISFLRYTENDAWWKINDNQNKREADSPLVYYSIRDLKENESLKVSLFVRNYIQEEKTENFGVFENLISGQAVALKISLGDQSMRSPSFILKNREIKNFTFSLVDGKLAYLGSSSRFKEITPPVFVKFADEQNILKELGIDLFGGFDLMGEVRAEERR